MLALPVSYYMVAAQLKGHGLVDIGVVIQERDDSNLERGRKPSAHTINISEAGMTPSRRLN